MEILFLFASVLCRGKCVHHVYGFSSRHKRQCDADASNVYALHGLRGHVEYTGASQHRKYDEPGQYHRGERAERQRVRGVAAVQVHGHSRCDHDRGIHERGTQLRGAGPNLNLYTFRSRHHKHVGFAPMPTLRLRPTCSDLFTWRFQQGARGQWRRSGGGRRIH